MITSLSLITLLCNIIVFLGFAGGMMCIWFVCYYGVGKFFRPVDKDDEEIQVIINKFKPTKLAKVIFVILMVLIFFIPTKKEIYVMYLAPKVIHAIESLAEDEQGMVSMYTEDFLIRDIPQKEIVSIRDEKNVRIVGELFNKFFGEE